MNEQRLKEVGQSPTYKNYLIYTDESGTDGKVYYGFGSLWMPWERRGDFAALVESLRRKHHNSYEIKWNKISRRSEALNCDLVEEFFKRNWLMFHCLVVRKGRVRKEYHDGDYDLARRKHFAMMMKAKIAFFSQGDSNKRYHVNIDPFPSRYAKADEAAHKIVNSTLKNDLGFAPVDSLATRESKETAGIQVADLLLGAVMSDWQETAVSSSKQAVKRTVAEHLGWPDLKADTHPRVWKFNIWAFHSQGDGYSRESRTREVKFKIPTAAYYRQRR